MNKRNKTKQNKTKQNKTKQNKTKQNKTKQNKTKQNKTKWSIAKQAWVACSEISSNQNRYNSSIPSFKRINSFPISQLTKGLLALGILSVTPVSWATCTSSGAGFTYIIGSGATTATCDIPSFNDSNTPEGHNTKTVIGIQSRARGESHIGDISLEYIKPVIDTDWREFAGITVINGYVNYNDPSYNAPSITAGNLRLKVIASNAVGNIYGGIQTKNGVNITAKDVNLDFDFQSNSGNRELYGILAGSSVIAGEQNNFINTNGLNGQYSTITVNNLIIKQTATDDANNIKLLPTLNSGIRAIQGAHKNSKGNGSTGKVIVKESLDMTLTGLRAVGIYVSGNSKNHGLATETGIEGQLTPEVILEGTGIHKITIHSTGESWDSHAIKLGKVRDVGEGSGILRSQGKLEIDTTDTVSGGAIKILRNSLLKADYTTSETKIRTAGYALQIGGTDDTSVFAASHGVSANFRNADFQTTGTSKDPRVVNGVNRNDLIFIDQGQVGTGLSFSGEKTALVANDEGYIINVSGNYDNSANRYYSNTYDESGTEKTGLDNFESSSVTFKATDAGSMTGLVNKGLIKQADKQTVRGSSTPTLNLELSNKFIWNLKKNTSEHVGVIDTIDPDTAIKSNEARFDVVDLSSGAVINGAFNNLGGNDFILSGQVNSDGGIINLDNTEHAKYNDILTIKGNYKGTGQALVKMNTLWNAPGDINGSNSQSDKLIITGTATGNTKVVPIGVNGQENLINGNVTQVVNTIINTVPVIEVQQTGDTAFTGTAKTSGIAEVQLAKRTNSITGYDEYYWTATALSPTHIIYDPAISGYINMPYINLEQGYTTLGTLHERQGENQTLAWDECGTCGAKAKSQTWGRIFGKYLTVDGKERLGFNTTIYGFQFGHNFRIKHNSNNSHSLAGAYIVYSRANHKFYDQFHAENGLISLSKYTGKGSSTMLSLGLTRTHYTTNGSYLDLVGQFSWLRNKYRSKDTSHDFSQRGWGLALSAEAGRPFALTKHRPNEAGWLIEPQVQLIYQHLSLNRLNDNYRVIKQGNQEGLRGRIGIRFAYNAEGKNLHTNTFYIITNIWHDFTNTKKIRIAHDKLHEKYTTTWGELGIGGQLPVGKQTYFYGDIRYERSLNSTKRSSYRGTIGAKFTWK